MPSPEESFVPFRGGPAVPGQVRSTVLVSSIQSLRARDLGPRYEAALPAGARERLLTLPPGLWVPVERAVEHYAALDSLGLDAATIQSMGSEVADRVYKSVLSTFVKLSSRAGVNPWTIFASSHRINDLSWRGTDVAVWKLGPKEARYEWRDLACAHVPYFRASFSWFLASILNMFCTKAYVKPLPRLCTPTSLAYLASWA